MKKKVGTFNVQTGQFKPWTPLSRKTDVAFSIFAATALGDDREAYERALEDMRSRIAEIEELVRQGMLLMPMQYAAQQEWMRKAINSEVGVNT